jgi:hypothetical protein
MDLVRGALSNSLETAKAVLDRRTKETDDTFRAHSTRDVDDQFETQIAQTVSAASGPKKSPSPAGTAAAAGPIVVDQRTAQIAMVLAGERASRTLKTADEMDNKTTTKFVEVFERFLLMQPAGDLWGSSTGGSASPSADAAAKGASDPNKRPEPLPTPFEESSSTAIAQRGLANAVRFYGEWGLRMLAKGAPATLARRLIYHLQAAIDNWRPGPGHITPAHGVLVEVCLKTHNAFSARRVLADAIYEVEPNLSGVTIFDYLDFYYFGGLCYTSLEQYDEAADFFSQVLQAPARGLSVRCLLAAKAHLLVTCIKTGEGEYPAQMRLGRHVMELTRDYFQFTEILSKAINSKNYDAQAVYNYPPDAKNEGLDGLCIKAIRAVPSHRAQKMTLTYKTVTLSGIARECGLDEDFAMGCLRNMVQNKTLSCRVDKQKGVVTFNEDAMAGIEEDEDGRRKRKQAEINDALQRVMEVNRAIQHRQDMALLSPGLLIATTGNLQQQIETTKKEMDQEKGGILGGFGLRR